MFDGWLPDINVNEIIEDVQGNPIGVLGYAVTAASYANPVLLPSVLAKEQADRTYEAIGERSEAIYASVAEEVDEKTKTLLYEPLSEATGTAGEVAQSFAETADNVGDHLGELSQTIQELMRNIPLMLGILAVIVIALVTGIVVFKVF